MNYTLRTFFGAVIALATMQSLFGSELPVAAVRPNKNANSARRLIVESSGKIMSAFRGERAGMFAPPHSHTVLQREVKRIRDSKALRAFLADRSLSIPDKVRRLVHWIMRRPPRDDEIRLVLKHIATKKDPHNAYIDVIWAYLNSKEFLLGESK